MKLMTKEIENKLPALYETDGTPVIDKPYVVKFFTPWANWTWYAFEGDKEGDDYRFFGLVDGMELELGYFMLSDLEPIVGPAGLKIERDLHFDMTQFKREFAENKKVAV